MSKKTKNSRGYELSGSISVHKKQVTGVFWSPDGRQFASTSRDGTARIWSSQSMEQISLFDQHDGAVLDIEWSPDGKSVASASWDQTIRIWDWKSGKELKRIDVETGPAISISWFGNHIAAASWDNVVQVWNLSGLRRLRAQRGHTEMVSDISFSRDGKFLASASRDGTAVIWDGSNGKRLKTLEGHASPVSCVEWSPTGDILATASKDETIKIWERASGKLFMTLEGHTASVKSLTFNSDATLLASKSADNTVRLWKCDTWECIVSIDESSLELLPSAISFHPQKPVLATLGDGEGMEPETSIRIWELDTDTLLNLKPLSETTLYKNAKVVLVGDSSVGKTGLAHRLALGEWVVDTGGSTHGMENMVMPLSEDSEREILLWDFAGQDDYRLIHQMFLNETSVALILYDPDKSDRHFTGVKYWESSLDHVLSGKDYLKFLVAGRVDVGRVRHTDEVIETYCKDNSYIGHFETSAKDGTGCNKLMNSLNKLIPWEKISATSSPELFRDVKKWLEKKKQENLNIAGRKELFSMFLKETQKEIEQEQFDAVLHLVENTGSIKIFSFGDLVLLFPKYLNGLASDIIDSARDHHEGLGRVDKEDVLSGVIHLNSTEKISDGDLTYLLLATVEMILEHRLAFEQDGNLVFPTKLNRQMETPEDETLENVEFELGGMVENVYSTLVVKFYYGGGFELKELYKNAAQFISPDGSLCGLKLIDSREGFGTMKVFFGNDTSEQDKALFIKLITNHLEEKNVKIQRKFSYSCSNCEKEIKDAEIIEESIEQGKENVFCMSCGTPVPLALSWETSEAEGGNFEERVKEIEKASRKRIRMNAEMLSVSGGIKRSMSFRQWVKKNKWTDTAPLTIVFADVMDYTGLVLKLGDMESDRVLDLFFERSYQLTKNFNGYRVKLIGDEVMAVFPTASNGLDFALGLSENAGHELVKIRVGIHSGTVIIKENDISGLDVAYTARIVGHDIAKAGGIWLSDSSKIDALDDGEMLRTDIEWKDYRDCELKGMPGRHTIWSVV